MEDNQNFWVIEHVPDGNILRFYSGMTKETEADMDAIAERAAEKV